MTQTPFGARPDFQAAPFTGAHRPPVLDMTPDGEFRTPPRPPFARPSFGTRLLLGSVVVAVLAAVAAVMALALWVAMALIPVAIVAGLLAYVTLRVQRWRAGGGLFRRQGGGWRGDGRIRPVQPGGVR